MATDQPVSALEEQRKNEKWARGRRKELRIAGIAAVLIFLGALYFGGLNAYLLYREAPEPLHIVVTQPAGAGLQADYRVTVAWDPVGKAGKTIVRPILLVHGIAIPPASARPSPSDPRLRTGERAELAFVINGDCTSGVHEGRINLQRVSGTPDAQEALSSPVRVEVVGGLWVSWFLLRDWLIASLFILALLYAFFFLLSPVPSGDLSLEHNDGVIHCRPVNLTLRPRRLALLMPWKRPVLPLALLFKRAGVPACGFAGEIVFQARRHPALLLAPSAADHVFRLGPVAVYRPGQTARFCSAAEVMWEESFIAFAEGRNRPPYLVLRYKAW